MIKDPIFKELESDVVKKWFAENPGVPFFWVEEHSIGLTKELKVAHWIINKSDQDPLFESGFFFGGSYGESNLNVSLEEFIERMRKEFPEYLEWLFWHPEWLKLE